MNNNADDFSYLKSMMPQVKDERFEKVMVLDEGNGLGDE